MSAFSVCRFHLLYLLEKYLTRRINIVRSCNQALMIITLKTAFHEVRLILSSAWLKTCPDLQESNQPQIHSDPPIRRPNPDPDWTWIQPGAPNRPRCNPFTGPGFIAWRGCGLRVFVDPRVTSTAEAMRHFSLWPRKESFDEIIVRASPVLYTKYAEWPRRFLRSCTYSLRYGKPLRIRMLSSLECDRHTRIRACGESMFPL